MDINKAFQAHEIIRKHANEREFPAQLQSIFLYIATKQDVGQEEIGGAVGISESSVSRNVSWLGPVNKLKRRSGLRWVEIYSDPRPDFWRHKRIRLTALGRQIIKEISEI